MEFERGICNAVDLLQVDDDDENLQYHDSSFISV